MRVNNASAAAESATPLAQRMLASTSKGESVPAVLMLEDGTVFYGRGCGAKGSAVGEVCFNTLEGYFGGIDRPFLRWSDYHHDLSPKLVNWH